MKFSTTFVFLFLIGGGVAFGGNNPFSPRPFLPLLSPTKSANYSILVPSPKNGETDKPIPPGPTFLRSLILPGWGEWKAGAHKRARVFWVSESVLAVAFAGFRLYGHLKANDYKAWAAIHAGADFNDKPERFATNISYYHDILEYNEYQRRLRRYDLVYPVTEKNWWQWDSPASRKRFNSLRIQSQTGYRNAVIVLGLVFANHVFSGIDAIWATHQYNKKISTFNRQPHFQMGALPTAHGAFLALTWNF